MAVWPIASPDFCGNSWRDSLWHFTKIRPRFSRVIGKFCLDPYGYSPSGPRIYIRRKRTTVAVVMCHGLGGHGLHWWRCASSGGLHGLGGGLLICLLCTSTASMVSTSSTVSTGGQWWRWRCLQWWRCAFTGGGGGQYLGGGLHLEGHGLGGGGGGTKFFHLHGLHWWRWWWWPRWWHWWRCAFSSASAFFVLVWWSPRSRPSPFRCEGLGQWWRCASVVVSV